MPFRMTPTLSCGLALIASFVLVFGAQAGMAASDGSAQKPAAKPRKALLLSREELRACQASKNQMEQQKGELLRWQSELTAEKAELVRIGNDLKEQLATLDRTNQELVGKYVAANNAREKRIDAFEASSGSYNDKLRELEAARAVYKKDCENRRFDEEDEMAIKKGK